MSLDQIAIARAFSECGVHIAALEADLAERTRERDEHAKWRMALADKLHDRETEIAEARADAARYRWLRDDALRLLVSGPICVAADKWGKPLTQHPGNNSEHGPALHITLDGKELDAAIDAAMKD